MLLARDLLRRCARNFPKKTAYYCGDAARTWSEIHSVSKSLAHAMLTEFSLRKGDAVATLGRESIAVYEQFFACLKAGMLRVGLNWRYSSEQISFILRDSRVRLLFVEEGLYDAFEDVIGAAAQRGMQVVVYDGAGHDSSTYNGLSLAGTGEMHNFAWPALCEDDPAFCTYTSGTTGNPKGVVHSQRSLVAMILQNVMARGLHIDDVWYTASASSWLTVVLNIMGVATGMTHVIMEQSFELERFLADIKTHRVTAVMLVPTVLRRLIEAFDPDQHDVSSVRLVMYGSSPASSALIKDCYRLFGCEMIQSYGMTECGWVSQLSGNDHRRAINGEDALLRSAGKFGTFSEVMICDDEGKPVPKGEVGNIHIRTESLMSYYLNMPEKTGEAIRDDWFCTNDLGWVDEEGYLYLVDRKAFMIVSGAVNIFPSSVEHSLASYPGLAEVCVVGAADPEWGEIVVAVLKHQDVNGTFDIVEFQRYCHERLNRFERPKRVYQIVGDFPRNANGKLEKKEVKAWVNESVPPSQLIRLT